MVEKLFQRRKRFRVALPVWVRLWHRMAIGAHSKKKVEVAEETITENISSAGCYFFLSHKPPVGASAVMEITVPGQAVGLKDSKVRCIGKVIRVDEKMAEGKVGVACAIKQYSFHSPAHKPANPKRLHPS